jgi:N-carbamoylputrescine amidase
MKVIVAATQMACSWDVDENLATAERVVRTAAARGANIVLLQEMFATHFFAFMDWKPEYFKFALPRENNPILARMASLARELKVVLPVNFFERSHNAYYNTIMMIDEQGRELGIYRKSHIPMGPPGCFEKVYTSAGDTGFKVWDTSFGRIGVGVCWDQWFPESARCMCLLGAELLFYPTGIGSDCHDHWQTVMQGHAGANLTPLIVSNRIGREEGEFGATTFWGRSFIAGPTGQILAKAGCDQEEVITCELDLEQIRQMRANWGVFRDRRPDLYGPLLSLDGRTAQVPLAGSASRLPLSADVFSGLKQVREPSDPHS